MKTIFFIIWMSTFLVSFAQKKTTEEEYIDKFKVIAIKEMEQSGIPASITLAQGIIESQFGNSRLALEGNNHFGIKCHVEWVGEIMYYDDDEKNECFRVYQSASESFHDHTNFLQTRPRYSFLFDYGSSDYYNWAYGLKKAGYATNPNYPKLLIDLIEREQLYLYDRSDRNYFAQRKHEEIDNNLPQEVSAQKEYKIGESKIYSNNTSIYNSSVSNEVFAYNRIKVVKVGQHDNLSTISIRNLIPQNKIVKYNDLEIGQSLVLGQFIYLQPKRAKAVHATHIVQTGETMWDISQLHGIKLEKLYERNLLSKGEEPANGTTVFLNKKTSKKPPLKTQEEIEKFKEIINAKEEAIISKTIIKEEKVIKGQKGLDDTIDNAELAKKNSYEPAKKDNLNNVSVKKIEPTIQETSPKTVNQEKENALVEKVINLVQHKVATGDTLYNISKKYNVAIDDLIKWNGLISNGINIGQVLQVKR